MMDHSARDWTDRKTLACWLAIGLMLLGGCHGNESIDTNTLPADPVVAAEPSGGADVSESADPSPADGNSTADDASSTGTANPIVAVGEDGVIELTFEDIQLPIQQDMVFRPFMLTDRVRDLDGQKIRIHGYMLPDSKTKGINQFVLLKNTECKFGPGGQADHLINVLMNDGVTATYQDEPISITGVLKVNPFEGPDGNTWSIYDVACEQVEKYRPRR